MNFYKRFVGDIQAKTGHLSCAEMGVYDRFLDHYYATESGLPGDIDDCCRIARAMSKDERRAVERVLRQFFTLADGHYRQRRADEEIAEAQPKIDAARTNGKRGGRPKRNPTETDAKPNGFLNETQSVENTKASQSQTKDSEANASAGKPAAEKTKAELWQAGKSLLMEAGVPAAQCGSFVGKLVSDYGEVAVVEAVRAAVVATPADPKEYLKATCQRIAGERKTPDKPLTVPSKAPDETARYLAEQAAHAEAARQSAAQRPKLVAPLRQSA